jgi:hypothetical protein
VLLRQVTVQTPLVIGMTSFLWSGPPLHRNRRYNHPFSRAILAASTRFPAPSLLIASDR